MSKREIEQQIEICTMNIQLVFDKYFRGEITMTDCVNQRNEIAKERIELYQKLKTRTIIEEPYIRQF